MAKLVLDNVTGGYDLSVINNNFDKIETALENTLSRDGTLPNSLSADLDLNGHVLLNGGGLDVSTLYIGGLQVLPSSIDIDARQAEVLNYAAIQAYDGALTSFYVQGHTAALDGGAGVFRVDPTDVVSADNGGTILVDVLGRRWKRDFSGPAFVEWFGAKPDGSDSKVAIQAAITAHASITATPGSTFDVASGISIPSSRLLSLPSVTIRRKTGSGVYDVIKNADQIAGNTDIVIRGLKVDGNKDADALVATTVGHRFSGISFVKVSGKSAILECVVIGTVNAEAHGGIYVDTCADLVVSKNLATANDRSGMVFFRNSKCTFESNTGHTNLGSGITGGDNADCTYAFNVAYSNGSGGTYTGINVTGPRVKAIGNTSYSNTGSGINIGEAVYDGSDTVAANNVCYSNTLEGITVGYSDRVKLIGNHFHSNVRNNVRIFQGADECQIIGNTIRDSAGGQGIYLDDGVGHVVSGNLIKGNASSGINIDSTSTDGVISNNRILNNGAVTTANSAGILCNASSGWVISNNRIYDTAGVGGTQESGIWMAGGSNNSVVNNILTTNKTNSIRETSSPSYTRRLNKIGTDAMNGTFTATGASTTTVVPNNNSSSATRVSVAPLNAAAAARPGFVSSAVVGTSFTVTFSGASAGTENYVYEVW